MENSGHPDGTDVPALTEAQKQELDRRLAAYDADPTLGSPWDDVKARIRDRL